MDQKTAIDKVKRYSELVTERFEVSKIVLFGSYARGNAGPESDMAIPFSILNPLTAY
jgi:predicted nucleotidyltransferase